MNNKKVEEFKYMNENLIKFLTLKIKYNTDLCSNKKKELKDRIKCIESSIFITKEESKSTKFEYEESDESLTE